MRWIAADRVSHLPGVLRRFLSARAGNFSMIMALSAPVVLFGIAAAIDYSRAAAYQQRLQSAADSAALASTTAMVNGQTATAAQDVGKNLFQSNVPGYSWKQNALNVYAGEANGVATTLVSYSTSMPTLFSGVTGSAATPVVVSATAAATLGSGSNNGGDMTFAGTGGIWGDPHMNGADGSQYMFSGCATTPISWYNMLSDAGIEVNFSCTLNTYWNEQQINALSIVVGSHVISVTDVQPTYTTNANGSTTINYNGQGWFGAVTIDGVTYQPVLGKTSYLNGLVQTNITDLTNPGNEDNFVDVNFTNGATSYAMTITYDSYAQAAITIAATNAGKCGIPGGIWGETLAGVDNTLSVYNYKAPTATATTTQFGWSTCAPGSALNTTAHLIQ